MDKFKKILVIRRDNIGDLACTTPAFAAIRKHYPNAEIAALVNSYNAQVLSGNPNVDYVFVYQKLKHAGGFFNRIKALAQRMRLILRLRAWQPDITILAKSSYDRHGLNFGRLIGARNVIGFVPEDTCQAKGLPDIQLPTPDFSSAHEVEIINNLLTPLGIDDGVGPLQVFPQARAISMVHEKFTNTRRKVALHISAREDERRWGTQNFIDLAQSIVRAESETQIMLFWSPGSSDDAGHPGDDEAAARMIASLGSDRVIPLPTNNLIELIAALSLCDIFIGTDGGALHLAVALNKPCIALFENRLSKLNHWYPWCVPNRVVYGERKEVASIPLAGVIEALVSLDAEVIAKD